MAFGDIYQLRTRCSYMGVNCYNTYFYIQNFVGSGEYASALSTGWRATVWDAVRNILSNALVYAEVEALNLRTLTDYFSDTIGGSETSGDVDADYNPPYMAWSVAYIRQVAGQRNGYKRYAGVPEPMVYNGVPNSAYEALFNAAADAHVEPIDVGAGDMLPVIVAHPISYGTNPTVSYAPTLAAFKGLTTQNTRKQ